MEIHAVKMPQQDTQNSPEKAARASIFSFHRNSLRILYFVFRFLLKYFNGVRS